MNLVNWSYFTKEEKITLNKMIDTGYVDGLTECVPNMTPAKELELQKIVDHITGKTPKFKSKIRERIEKEGHPETPEQEAKLQEELVNEYRNHAEDEELKQLKRLSEMGDETAKEDYKALKDRVKARKKEEKERAAAEEKRLKEIEKNKKKEEDKIHVDTNVQKVKINVEEEKSKK